MVFRGKTFDNPIIYEHIRCESLCTKSCIASLANGIRIAISGWGKINLEPLREHPKGLLWGNINYPMPCH